MGNRRRARELALQALFYMDINKRFTKELFDRFCENFDPPETTYPFFEKLVCGVTDKLSELDPLIERYSMNWKLSRMACVDRNILRIAAYEMLFCNDIPPKVTINEAIEISKRFGTEESGAFINGIVDSIRLALKDRLESQSGLQPIISPGGMDRSSD
jgi:N utilization substance protein B